VEIHIGFFSFGRKKQGRGKKGRGRKKKRKGCRRFSPMEGGGERRKFRSSPPVARGGEKILWERGGRGGEGANPLDFSWKGKGGKEWPFDRRALGGKKKKRARKGGGGAYRLIAFGGAREGGEGA